MPTFSGNTYLEATGVRQIHKMRLHTEILTPFGLATGSLIVMASMRRHDTQIAPGKSFETGVTMALTIALARSVSAGLAIDGTGMDQGQLLADQAIELNLSILNRQKITQRRPLNDAHFLQQERRYPLSHEAPDANPHQ